MTDQPLLSFEERKGITVGRVQTASVLDAMNVARFGAEVLACIQRKPGLHLLLDFEKVDYLSSAVLTELLRVNEAVKAAKGTLRLCGLNKDIQKVFEITNLDKMFTIYRGGDEALTRYLRSLDVEAQEASWQHIAGEE